ncbi:hypothetical protein DPX16_14816 [Anabarilius grahami]|uniref:Uncharacterized protein n=1 Tax=Anabarilius grahami TaxID=495550 RepID=A0A3N0YAI9_ANAGA|nr:hypothetical protein DPX16_14816 [Anabarilius grahami]
MMVQGSGVASMTAEDSGVAAMMAKDFGVAAMMAGDYGMAAMTAVDSHGGHDEPSCGESFCNNGGKNEVRRKSKCTIDNGNQTRDGEHNPDKQQECKQQRQRLTKTD